MAGFICVPVTITTAEFRHGPATLPEIGFTCVLDTPPTSAHLWRSMHSGMAGGEGTSSIIWSMEISSGLLEITPGPVDSQRHMTASKQVPYPWLSTSAQPEVMFCECEWPMFPTEHGPIHKEGYPTHLAVQEGYTLCTYRYGKLLSSDSSSLCTERCCSLQQGIRTWNVPAESADWLSPGYIPGFHSA